MTERQYYYRYNEKDKTCQYVIDDGEEGMDQELDKISETSSSVVFEHDYLNGVEPALLTIEKRGDNIYEITLSNVKNDIPAVRSVAFRNKWWEVDWGKLIWKDKHQDYLLEKGHPKSFYSLLEFIDDQKEKDKPIAINFLFEYHLVLKDKDPQKNWIWYQFDYNFEISHFLYDLLSEDIKPDLDKEIVAIPGELDGNVLDPWSEAGYMTNSEYYETSWPEKEKDPKQDFYWETRKNWLDNYEEPGLVITFLPTYEDNYKLEEKHKITGTRWFRKLYEVFIQHGTPLVLKCYPEFIRQMKMKHQDWAEKLSETIELPLSINGKAMGTGITLAFFNLPRLKGIVQSAKKTFNMSPSAFFDKWYYEVFLPRAEKETSGQIE